MLADRKQLTKTPTVLYTIFQECADQTEDEYWKQVFDDCSRGKFPRGSGISHNAESVVFRTSTTVFHYKLTEDPIEVFEELKDLFRVKLGMISDIDHSNLDDEHQLLAVESEKSYSNNWKDIRKKKTKEAIQRNFVTKLAKKYSLTKTETMDLNKRIKLAFVLNQFAPTDVVYEGREIVEIKNLRYEDGKFHIDHTPLSSSREYVINVSKMSSLWEKNAKTPRNRYIITPS